MTEEQPDHVKRIAEMAHGMVEAASSTLIDLDQPERGSIRIRVGVHSGPVSADVVGSRNPRFCLFGDTGTCSLRVLPTSNIELTPCSPLVNVASRMESHSLPNRVHMSEVSAALLRDQKPSADIVARGETPIKGKGTMFTYWLGDPTRTKTLEFSKPSSSETQIHNHLKPRAEPRL